MTAMVRALKHRCGVYGNADRNEGSKAVQMRTCCLNAFGCEVCTMTNWGHISMSAAAATIQDTGSAQPPPLKILEVPSGRARIEVTQGPGKLVMYGPKQFPTSC